MQVLLGGRLDLGNTFIVLNTRSQSPIYALVMLARAGILLPYLLEQWFRERGSVMALIGRRWPSIRVSQSHGQRNAEITSTVSFSHRLGIYLTVLDMVMHIIIPYVGLFIGEHLLRAHYGRARHCLRCLQTVVSFILKKSPVKQPFSTFYRGNRN